jgi:hypothetical protein
MLTREEARAFKARWEMVNRVTAAEAAGASAEDKLRQLAVLYEAAAALSRGGPSERGEAGVRARWLRLKEVLHA